MSDTSVTFSASNPYAFNIVVNISSVSEDSANPAVASFVDSRTKLTASPVSCPALIALYVLSAISETAIPVSFDNSIIESDMSSTDITLVSIIVDTFAISSSKSVAILPAAIPNEPIPADTTDNFFPNFSTFSPAFLHADANLSHLCFFNSSLTSLSSLFMSVRDAFDFSVFTV